MRLLFTVNEAARILSLSRPFIYRLIQRGEIASLKVGGLRRIALEDLQKFVAQLRASQVEG
ncbi:MAG: helix-turn-helix domain-containing protein [Ktedonobacterales bacterium]|nr:helix-turn-helix domain-containing protein [Ktedonobacterales bacterium]